MEYLRTVLKMMLVYFIKYTNFYQKKALYTAMPFNQLFAFPKYLVVKYAVLKVQDNFHLFFLKWMCRWLPWGV